MGFFRVISVSGTSWRPALFWLRRRRTVFQRIRHFSSTVFGPSVNRRGAFLFGSSLQGTSPRCVGARRDRYTWWPYHCWHAVVHSIIVSGGSGRSSRSGTVSTAAPRREGYRRNKTIATKRSRLVMSHRNRRYNSRGGRCRIHSYRWSSEWGGKTGEPQ